MHIQTFLIGAAALLFSSMALSQAGGHQGHGRMAEPASSRPAPPKKQEGMNMKAEAKPAPASPAFHGYRPYTPDEPLVSWREANDLVLDIGGHVGIMKGATGKVETTGTHAGHTKPQPAGTGRK